MARAGTIIYTRLNGEPHRYYVPPCDGSDQFAHVISCVQLVAFLQGQGHEIVGEEIDQEGEDDAAKTGIKQGNG